VSSSPSPYKRLIGLVSSDSPARQPPCQAKRIERGCSNRRGKSLLKRASVVVASLLVLSPALADTAQPAEPVQSATACSPEHQPTGLDLATQIKALNPGITQLAVSPVTDFAGFWKFITDSFGPPPADVVADPNAIKSLQVVWFIDPTDPTGVINADVYAFDAQNCYVIDIGIDASMFDKITPFTTMPSLATKP
jgi:hypothetical protein